MATTHQDTNVNQLVINKMTKQEYDNLSQVSETELYLVEEQVDSVVTQNSTNPVQSGAVYEALHEIESAINDGTTLFTKNNKTVGIISANQALDKTIKIPNDIIMCKMSDGIVYDSYITYTKIKQYLPDYPYYSDDLDWEIGGNPPMRANITADNYYLDVDTNHIFVADENLELLDITSSVVIHGDINKLYCDVDINMLYRYDGTNFVLLNAKTNEIVDNFIITKDETNHWYAYPLEGIYIGLVEGIDPPVFYDKATSSLHTFTSDDYNKYFYDYIDNKMYMCFRSGDSPTLYCISDVPLYNLENLDTTKTYISYGTNKIYRTNDGTEFKLIATNSYNDLSNKPLSVENSKVKYTLSDGTTKLTLSQESDLKNVAFTGKSIDCYDLKITVPDYKCCLIADIDDFYRSSSSTINLPFQGFVGRCLKERGGGNIAEASAEVSCCVSYQNTDTEDHFTISSTHFDINPCIVLYNNKYYLCIDINMKKTSNYILLYGYLKNCLNTPLLVNSTDCTVVRNWDYSIKNATTTTAGLMSAIDKKSVTPIIIKTGSIVDVLKSIGNSYGKQYILHIYGNVTDKPYSNCYITVNISNELGYTAALFAQEYGGLHCKTGYVSINPSSSSTITWSNDII